ncbi:MAG TPA: hypothetical protein VHI54_05215 [Actinomycetota bacterium]|nr:hypothetical protein [Actinomycetota bacterium]
MRAWMRLAIAVLLLASCTSGGRRQTLPASDLTIPPAATRAQDVATAIDEYLQSHPDPDFAVRRSRLLDEANELKVRADDLPASAFLVELMRLLALPGRVGGRDGHTGVFPLDDHQTELHLLPLRLYWFPDGMMVVDATAPYRHLVGSEIVAIGTQRIQQAIDAVEPLVPRDNVMTMKARLPQYLVVTEILEGLRIAPAGATTLEFRRDRTRFRDTVHPISAEQFADRFAIWHEMIPPSLPERDEPLYLRNVSKEFVLTYLERQDTLYLQYNQATFDTSDLSRRLTRLIRHREPAKLVIDLRHNPGGDNTTYRSLLGAIKRSALNRPGRLFAIIGRSTFSAAGHFATELERETHVTFAGELGGYSPNGFGDPNYAVLMASGIIVNVGAVYWEKSRAGDRRLAVRPAIRGITRSDDFFSRRDPVLEAILVERS